MVNSMFCDCRWRQLSTSVWYRSLGKRWKYSAACLRVALRSFVNFSRTNGSRGIGVFSLLQTQLANEIKGTQATRFARMLLMDRMIVRTLNQRVPGSSPGATQRVIRAFVPRTAGFFEFVLLRVSLCKTKRRIWTLR